MTGMTPGNDFYEEDEPVEKIAAAFEQGKKGVTAPARGRTEHLRTPFFPRVNEPAGHRVAPR